MSVKVNRSPCGCGCGGPSAAFGSVTGGTNSQCHGFTGGTTPHWRAGLNGYSTPWDGQQHVNYVAADGHVHELFFDGHRWQDNDLFQLAGLPGDWAANATALAGYPTGWNNQQHVNWIGLDGSVHELFFDGNKWHDNNLFNLAGISDASVGNNNALSGYCTAWNNQQHVNYISADGRVHELFFDGSNWHDNDLFGLAGLSSSAAATINSALDSYPGSSPQQHVNYIDPAGQVHELFFDGNKWHDNNLFNFTDIPGSFEPPLFTALDGYLSGSSQQHVNWIDGSANVRELFFDGNTWHDNNLFHLAGVAHGSAATIGNSALHGYAGLNQQQHVNFIDQAGQVHELFFDGNKWHDNNLFGLAGLSEDSQVAPISTLDGYTTQGQQHVNYISADGYVHELFFDGSNWHNNDLSTMAWATLSVVVPNPLTTLPNPQIVLIYWGAEFSSNPALVTSMDQFVSDLATGNYWAGLKQYGVGTPTVAPHVIIDVKTFPTPNSQNPGQAVTEDQLQAWLVARLEDGTVTPAPDNSGQTNRVYLILPPSDTTFSFGGNTTGFCGYHQHTGYDTLGPNSPDNLVWAMVIGGNRASDGHAYVDSVSYCVTHELSEALSNPTGHGWYNINGCEISDLCESSDPASCCTTVPYTVSGRTYQVETYWSNVDKKCISGWDSDVYPGHVHLA